MNERFLDYPGLQKYDQKIKQHIADNAPDSPSVTSVNGKTGAVTISANDISAVPTSRTVNGKALSGDISLTASDVSAVPASRTVNGKALTSDISISALDISAVPTSRKVNGKTLSSDISLTASDVGATGKTVPNGSTVTVDSSGTTATVGTGVEIFNDYRTAIFLSSDYPEAGNAAVGNYSHAEGSCTVALGEYAHTEGYVTKAGSISHAEGYKTTASGDHAHAEGWEATASGKNSHAEGWDTTASGENSHAEGYGTVASGPYAHAHGNQTTASGAASFAGGSVTTSSAICSFAFGTGIIASGTAQSAFGTYNVKSSKAEDKLIIGKGTTGTARANCFRVTDTATYATGNYNSTGADYAELFEWEDGNPDAEDRVARFVTLDGEKIRIATPDDHFILGIISGNPSVVGDVHDDQWKGMYLYDKYGRPVFEDVEVPGETLEEPDSEDPSKTIINVIVPAHTEYRQKLNPDYDPSQPYISRSERPEWGCVGLLGKLVVIDDGTCQVNGYAAVGSNGTATRSLSQTRYRVLSRIDETLIRIMVL